jgi:hypothetical protein
LLGVRKKAIKYLHLSGLLCSLLIQIFCVLCASAVKMLFWARV